MLRVTRSLPSVTRERHASKETVSISTPVLHYVQALVDFVLRHYPGKGALAAVGLSWQHHELEQQHVSDAE